MTASTPEQGLRIASARSDQLTMVLRLVEVELLSMADEIWKLAEMSAKESKAIGQALKAMQNKFETTWRHKWPNRCSASWKQIPQTETIVRDVKEAGAV